MASIGASSTAPSARRPRALRTIQREPRGADASDSDRELGSILGPQRDAPTWAADQLLASALADVRVMTAELGGRATVLDARQRLWTKTLEALVDVLSSLDAPQRAKLRSDLKKLDSEGRTLLDRARRRAPGVPFEANKVHLDQLKVFAK